MFTKKVIIIEVRIIFKDATAEKIYTDVDNIYTKGEMLVIREGDWLWKYPLMNIFSVCHKHGVHWGSQAHKNQIRKAKTSEETANNNPYGIFKKDKNGHDYLEV